MTSSIKNNIIFYLLFLTPFTFVLGISIMEISTFLITLFFFLKNRDLNYFKDTKFLFLFIFSLYVAINAFFQIHDNLKISSFFFFRYVILALSIFFFLKYLENNFIKNKKNILLVFSYLLLFIFFDSFLQFITQTNLFGFEMINQRISSLFGSELILGSFLIKLLPLFLYLLFYLKIKINTNFLKLALFFGLYFSVIYLAAGRTSFFIMCLLILLIIIFIKELRLIFSIGVFFLVSLIFITQIFEIGKSNPSNRLFVKTFNEMTNHIFYNNQKKQNLENSKSIKKNDVVENIKIFSIDHHGHYVLAYELFKKNFVFGIGPKGFRYYCRSVEYNPPKGICSTHPHNFVVQILTETGLIGFVFYIYAFIFVIFKMFRVYAKKIPSNEKNCFFVISIALITIFFPFVPNGNFFNNWISITSFYYIGIYLYSYKHVYL